MAAAAFAEAVRDLLFFGVLFFGLVFAPFFADAGAFPMLKLSAVAFFGEGAPRLAEPPPPRVFTSAQTSSQHIAKKEMYAD